MDFLDERAVLPTPEKEGIYYIKQDPDLGKIRGLDPWAVENGIHLIRMEADAAEGIMMIRRSNQQQYGTVHGGMLVAFANTDEIFAVAMGRTAPLTPAYMYGLAALPILGWTGGTVVGAVAGAVLSPAVRSALGVALYSMFIAIVVPPMRHSKPVQAVVAAAVIVSCVFAWTPLSEAVGSGFAIVISTLAAAALGAWLFPMDVSPEADEEKEAAR